MDLKKLNKVLRKEIALSSNVFIIGHNDLDLDAIGAAIGISLISKRLNRKPYIIVNDNILENGVEKILNESKNLNIICNANLNELLDEKSLLIIVDTNKLKLTSIDKYIKKFNEVIVIDHHTKNYETIEKENVFIYTDVSSTCEIIASLLIDFKINLTPKEATYVLSGIVLDTSNFTLKAKKETFYYAYYLLSKGATIYGVQQLLKQNLLQFITNQKMLLNSKTYGNIAITLSNTSEYFRREDLAKVADTLLTFDNIEISFAIAYTDENEVSISARSMGDLDVGLLLEKMQGGGNKQEAGTKIKNKKIKTVEKELKELLNI